MMDFHYNVIEKQYTDTDSLIYKFINVDVFDDVMTPNKDWFDLTKMKRRHLKDDANDGVLGKFKDELHAQIMTEWLALNPKVYSHKYLGLADADTEEGKDKLIDDFEHELKEINKKKVKGVSKVVVNNDIKHEDFEHVLDSNKSISKDVYSIGTFNHQLFTILQTKTALTPYYDKMFMLNNNECVPFGFMQDE